MVEKKLSDPLIGGAVFIVILGILLAMIINFDSQYSPNHNISDNLSTIHALADSNYKNTEVSLEQDTFNTSSFTVQENIQVDTRGVSQANLITRNNPSMIISVLNTASDMIPIHNSIKTFLGFMAILIGIILILRFIRPGGA